MKNNGSQYVLLNLEQFKEFKLYYGQTCQNVLDQYFFFFFK